MDETTCEEQTNIGHSPKNLLEVFHQAFDTAQDTVCTARNQAVAVFPHGSNHFSYGLNKCHDQASKANAAKRRR